MRFQHQGKLYRLEFERQYRNLKITRNGVTKEVRSKYPYTTAKLLQLRVGEEPLIVGKATVGCCPTDAYSNELGRRQALRQLTFALAKRDKTSKDLRTAFWNAYLNRGKQLEKLPVTTTITNPQLALPPASTESVH